MILSCVFCFFYLHYCCPLNSCRFLLLIQRILPWFVNPINLSLIQLLFYFFFYTVACVTHNLKSQIFFQHLLQYIHKSILFLWKQWRCLYSNNKVLHLNHILVLHNHTKIHIFQFYSDVILINLEKQAYE